MNPYTDQNDLCVKTATQLPEWLTQGEQNLFKIQTSTNGHCLFHSVHIALFSVCKEMNEIPYTSNELLLSVVNTFLDDKNVAAQTQLKGWVEILRACKKIHEYRFEQLNNRFANIRQAIKNKDFEFVKSNLHVKGILDGKTHSSDSIAKTLIDILSEKRNEFYQAEYYLTTWKSKIEETINNEYQLLLQDLGHVECLVNVKEDRHGIFPLEARKKLVESMKLSHIFWGEEYTLRTLQEMLKVKFIILKPSLVKFSDQSEKMELVVQHLMEKTSFDSDWYFLLYFTGNHYQPIVRKVQNKHGKWGYLSCFTKKTLPSFVLSSI